MFRTINVIHIIPSLNVGGAECALQKLIISHQKSKLVFHRVVTLVELGMIGDQLRSDGFEVICLRWQGGLRSASSFFRLVRLIRDFNPDIVQTWMYHSNMLGGFAAKLAGVHQIIWGIRSTYITSRWYSQTRLIRILSAPLSYWIPRKIICVGRKSLNVHARLGYDKSKLEVIGNGFLVPTNESIRRVRKPLRESLGCVNKLVILSVGRFSSRKKS